MRGERTNGARFWFLFWLACSLAAQVWAAVGLWAGQGTEATARAAAGLGFLALARTYAREG